MKKEIKMTTIANYLNRVSCFFYCQALVLPIFFLSLIPIISMYYNEGLKGKMITLVYCLSRRQ
jgi:hypothetical protein